MDYGTPTSLPWGVVYSNPESYAPNDGIPRHPDQYYELVGDLVIARVLLRLRGKLPDGALFLVYLVLFSVFRFFLFFCSWKFARCGAGPQERSVDRNRNSDRHRSTTCGAAAQTPIDLLTGDVTTGRQGFVHHLQVG
jgi:hypothetical protein